MRVSIVYKWVFSGMMVLLISCTKNLDRNPITSVTSVSVFNNPTAVSEAFAKLYAGLSLSGQGVTTDPDIAASDVGANTYFRNFWEAQELPTDEAVISWNDADLQQYHLMNWTSTNSYIRMLYYRIYLEISLCNQFLRETSNLNNSDFSAGDTATISEYRNEARFLRALSYWHAIDFFGNVPFVTENDPVGTFTPPQRSRADVFAFIESELSDLQNRLPDPKQNAYGRADKAAAWMVLAKLYMNAEVYTSTARYTDAITYCNKIISSGAYHLAASYAQLFQIDNRNTGEIIFPIRANGITSQSYGNTTFLVHAEIGGSMNPTSFGVQGAWAGLRTTQNLVNLFPDANGTTDQRAMFYTNGQTLQINNITNFTNGYAVTKFRNVSSNGTAGSDPSGNFVDVDFPMFRLGDVYLMYAEAVLRGGGGGSAATALGYINALRQRAYGSTAGNITAADLTLNFIINERARELYWEAHRRTDLIRFGLFTSSSYVWPWKGGVQGGTGVDPRYNLYPIPSTDILANPTLIQNPGY